MRASKFFKICLLVLLVVFIINQLVSALYTPIKTETAEFYTANDGFNITGHIIRDETTVKSKSGGVLHFVTEDGSRVSKNGVIANIYSNESASITVSQINILKSQIADIEDVLSYNDIQAANLDLINTRINDKLNDLLFSSSAGNFAENEKLSEELLSAQNRKQAALGDTSGLSKRLSGLKKELKELSSSLPSATGSIRAKESGYFVSKTDGYESVFKVSELDKITPEYLNSAKPKAVPKDTIGKIVSDYEWYIAATVSINDSLKYKEGQELKILTSIKSSPSLSVTVTKINISEKKETAVMIFACSDMNSELANIRTATMTVVSHEYSGLRVPNKALRFIGKEKGVYVENGMQINFVPIEIVYRNDEYMIVEKVNENGNYLKLYDKVVVKGKNLYDGKIIG